jgi:hypothetical protein
MFYRPWRWLIALVASLLILGAINAIGQLFGASELFGLGSAIRAVILLALACLISVFVLPSPEKVDQRETLPPLPDVSSLGVSRVAPPVESQRVEERPVEKERAPQRVREPSGQRSLANERN